MPHQIEAALHLILQSALDEPIVEIRTDLDAPMPQVSSYWGHTFCKDPQGRGEAKGKHHELEMVLVHHKTRELSLSLEDRDMEISTFQVKSSIPVSQIQGGNDGGHAKLQLFEVLVQLTGPEWNIGPFLPLESGNSGSRKLSPSFPEGPSLQPPVVGGCLPPEQGVASEKGP